MTNTVVKSQTVPSVQGHLIQNSRPTGASPVKSRHQISGQAKQVAINLGSQQPNTDRRRYVTHR